MCVFWRSSLQPKAFWGVSLNGNKAAPCGSAAWHPGPAAHALRAAVLAHGFLGALEDALLLIVKLVTPHRVHLLVLRRLPLLLFFLCLPSNIELRVDRLCTLRARLRSSRAGFSRRAPTLHSPPAASSGKAHSQAIIHANAHVQACSVAIQEGMRWQYSPEPSREL